MADAPGSRPLFELPKNWTHKHQNPPQSDERVYGRSADASLPYLVAIESFRAYSGYVIGVFPQPNGNGKPRVQRRRRRNNNWNK